MYYNQTLDKTMSRGLDYILSAQLEDGSFDSFAYGPGPSPEPIPAGAGTVIPAIMLNALAQCGHAKAAPIADKLAPWLLSQRNAAWSFPYWVSGTNKAPDQHRQTHLHSTVLALNALCTYRPEIITGEVLGNIARMLVNAEQVVGGPYYTHTTASHSQSGIDIATNSTINHFLSRIAEPLPNLNALAARAVKNRSFASPWFASPYATTYCLARIVPPDQQQTLSTYIHAQLQSNREMNALDIAFAIAALTALGAAVPDHALSQLISAQHTDGSWNSHACWIAPDSRAYGSAALTTAIAVEALNGIRSAPAPRLPITSDQPVLTASMDTTIYRAAIDVAKNEVQRLQSPLRQHCLQTIERIQQHDKNHEIVLLGYFFQQSLIQPQAIDQQLLIQLGAANVYNWMAYSIYDDFLDMEGKPELLSAANVALRYSLDHFCQALPAHAGYQQAIRDTFDAVDTANAWEIKHCRFAVRDTLITIGPLPRYGYRSRLAERSCTHGLPVLAVLAKTGTAPHDPAVQACLSGFKHYLIARQLNDDMHDWEEDIAAGNITYVVRTILEALAVSQGPTELTPLLTGMQQRFWDDTLERICQDISRHTRQGRRALRRSGLLQPQNYIRQRLDALDSVVAYSKQEQRTANTFLSAYRTGNKPDKQR